LVVPEGETSGSEIGKTSGEAEPGNWCSSREEGDFLPILSREKKTHRIDMQRREKKRNATQLGGEKNEKNVYFSGKKEESVLSPTKLAGGKKKKTIGPTCESKGGGKNPFAEPRRGSLRVSISFPGEKGKKKELSLREPVGSISAGRCIHTGGLGFMAGTKKPETNNDQKGLEGCLGLDYEHQKPVIWMRIKKKQGWGGERVTGGGKGEKKRTEGESLVLGGGKALPCLE